MNGLKRQILIGLRTYWSGLPRSDFSPPITKTRLYWLPGNILGSTIAVLGCYLYHKYENQDIWLLKVWISNWMNTLAVWRNLGYLSCPTNLHLENLNFWNNFKYWISTVGRLLEKMIQGVFFCGLKSSVSDHQMSLYSWETGCSRNCLKAVTTVEILNKSLFEIIPLKHNFHPYHS